MSENEVSSGSSGSPCVVARYVTSKYSLDTGPLPSSSIRLQRRRNRHDN